MIGGFQLAYTEPRCNFPMNYTGHWYHTSEFDVDVDINMTHVYFYTKIDQFNFKESYFTCMMNSGTRYLVMAITVGKWFACTLSISFMYTFMYRVHVLC